MRTTKTQVYELIKILEEQNYKVRWTCCSPEGRLRWWISVENKHNMYSWSDINGSTREVYMWLRGILAGFALKANTEDIINAGLIRW